MANEFLSTLRSVDIPVSQQDVKASWATHRASVSSNDTLQLNYDSLSTALASVVIDLATKGSVKPSDIEGAAYLRVRGIFTSSGQNATVYVVGWTEADTEDDRHYGEILWTGTLHADTAVTDGANTYYVSDSVEVDARGVSKVLAFVTTAPTSGSVSIEARVIW